ncbi:muconolactone Delta-isomerase [Aliidongia dinghuensis]|uniref:Muconolactone Delta-isomerase n=1 Tax=Aliidongia dinghuensis TaxID=1867774 RepID=A0A8J2YTN9_9PROT|nr:muconolactone Delta-isomerase [Aliidongia dinghuensis]GGF19664.1 muconolactone Delta-isomerase [Aliidongia dinghuensis]
MLFQVEMDVHLPHDMPAERADELKRVEKARCQQLMRDGTWRHLWRIAGRYANVSVFDVTSHDALHEILTSLPLFPFMTMKVTALCRHPSSIRDDDR